MQNRETEVITSALALRAIAHPLRIRLLDELLVSGQSTATELAEVVGESPANCSWHLRQLAKYGYIEEAPGGTGRQRPWRLVVGPRSWGDSDEAELTIAGDAATSVLADYEFQALRAWEARKASEPLPWRSAASMAASMDWLTLDELNALNDELLEVMTRHLDRVADPSRRPAGARPIRLVAWAIPAKPLDNEGDPHARGAT